MTIQNTVDREGTHFLAAVHLIQQARHAFGVCSENWTVPTGHKIGSPSDKFYAEVWGDGMDWNAMFWVIYRDSVNLTPPRVLPLIFFDQVEELGKFNIQDFRHLVEAMLIRMRNHFWLTSEDDDQYEDLIWSFLRKFSEVDRPSGVPEDMQFCLFRHYSQVEVSFWAHKIFLNHEEVK